MAYTTESFETLVKRAFSGDSVAFDEIYKPIHTYLNSFLSDYHISEDIALDTLRKTWQRWETDVRNRSKLKSWMYQTAHNAAIDYHRQRAKHPFISLISNSNEDNTTDFHEFHLVVTTSHELPEQCAVDHEETQNLKKALLQVPELSRSCIILRTVERMKTKEIAKIHNCSTKTIERHIVSGMEAFRQAYKHITEGPHTIRLKVQQPHVERS